MPDDRARHDHSLSLLLQSSAGRIAGDEERQLMNPCCTVGDHLNGYSAFGGTKGARKEEVRLQSSLIAGKIADDTHVFNESRLSLSL